MFRHLRPVISKLHWKLHCVISGLTPHWFGMAVFDFLKAPKNIPCYRCILHESNKLQKCKPYEQTLKICQYGNLEIEMELEESVAMSR